MSSLSRTYSQLFLDGLSLSEVEASQAWVLSAMQTNGPALISMLWRILGNEQDVCDAYQDTFLQLAHFNRGGKPKHIKAYLFRTASNVALTVLRKKKIHQRACESIAQTVEDCHCEAAGAEMDADQMREELRMYIARLPDYLRGVVVLRDLAELPYDEVARILEISAGSARVYRRRAIQMLATMMGRRK